MPNQKYWIQLCLNADREMRLLVVKFCDNDIKNTGYYPNQLKLEIPLVNFKLTEKYR